MINVGIIGGTGYTGVELLRLLLGHPQVHIQAVTSRGEAGTRVADLFPNLRIRKSCSMSTGIFCHSQRHGNENGRGIVASGH